MFKPRHMNQIRNHHIMQTSSKRNSAIRFIAVFLFILSGILIRPSILYGQADIYITDPARNLSSVSVGSAINMSCTINVTQTIPTSWPLKYYISTNTVYDASDIELGSSMVSGGTHASFSYTFPCDFPIGTYYIIFYVDPDNQIIESNENNNIAVSPSFNVTYRRQMKTVSGGGTICPGETAPVTIENPESYTFYYLLKDGVRTGDVKSGYPITWDVGEVGTYTVEIEDLDHLCSFTANGQAVIQNPPVPAVPGNIDGPSELCSTVATQSFSCPSVPNGNYYMWTIDAQAGTITDGQGTTNITVTFNTSNEYDPIITVRPSNCIGQYSSGFRSKAITRTAPVVLSPITGPSTVCPGTTGVAYSQPVSSGVNYSWSTTGGITIASGNGTQNVTANFPSDFISGSISVMSGNICGSTPPQTINISSTALPLGSIGPISGPTTVMQSQTNVTYSIAEVTNATEYHWTLLDGTTQVTTTPTLTYNIPADAVSGILSVKAANLCSESASQELAITVIPATGGVPQSEYDALVALYNSTNGPSWTNSTSWLTSAPVSDWYGVEVVNGHVEMLSLNSNNLVGTIPSLIGDLTYLRALFLPDNGISNPLPPEIQNLHLLYNLALEGNNLSGAIPSWINGSNFPNLIYIYLGMNGFSGTIPSTLGSIQSLNILNLQENNLTGEVPFTSGDLSSLESLILDMNDITGSFDFICDLPSLEKIYVDNCQFSETIPECINNLASLSNVWVRGNHLTFEDLLNVPGGLAYFIYYPQANIGTAATIDLTAGQSYTINLGIDENVPNNQYRWLKDGIETDITTTNSYTVTANNSEDAGIYTCEVTNPDLPLLTLYSEPVTITVEENCHGVTCEEYDALVELYNSTNGPGWTNSTNWLTSAPVSDWYGVTVTGGYVTSIDLVSNYLTGTIPESIGNLSNITYIDLSNNQLSGSIPETIGNL